MLTELTGIPVAVNCTERGDGVLEIAVTSLQHLGELRRVTIKGAYVVSKLPVSLSYPLSHLILSSTNPPAQYYGCLVDLEATGPSVIPLWTCLALPQFNVDELKSTSAVVRIWRAREVDFFGAGGTPHISPVTHDDCMCLRASVPPDGAERKFQTRVEMQNACSLDDDHRRISHSGSLEVQLNTIALSFHRRPGGRTTTTPLSQIFGSAVPVHHVKLLNVSDTHALIGASADVPVQSTVVASLPALRSGQAAVTAKIVYDEQRVAPDSFSRIAMSPDGLLFHTDVISPNSGACITFCDDSTYALLPALCDALPPPSGRGPVTCQMTLLAGSRLCTALPTREDPDARSYQLFHLELVARKPAKDESGLTVLHESGLVVTPTGPAVVIRSVGRMPCWVGDLPPSAILPRDTVENFPFRPKPGTVYPTPTGSWGNESGRAWTCVTL